MPIIKVENLSKKYILSHKQRESYTNLRDVISERFNAVSSRVLHPFTVHHSPFTNTSHEEFWALKDVAFEINQGDRVGIIGRNGAGKSTLLKILSRITEPTSGKIGINGRVASLLEVGTGFHPELTGRENIYLNGAILGMQRLDIKRKFDEIVAFAEVERFLDTPVKHYSSGMYVRLAFAVAAHLEPEILIVDEVLAVGDAQFQKKCLGKMEQVGRGGRTVLFVSHNMTSIKALCGRTILLRNGNIFYNGNTAVAIESYLADSNVIDNSISIINRKRDRKCSLRAKIVNVTITDGSGKHILKIDAMEILTVCMTIQSDKALECSAQIVIFDELQPLSYMDSSILHNKLFKINAGITEITCRVGPINFYAGAYKIRCGINIPFMEVIDEIDACDFEIIECDPYKSGFNLLKKDGFGLFHVQNDWQ